MDVARLKSSFARIAMYGDEVPLHFYADLFLKHPETRELFPVSMQAQRGHLVEALVTIVSERRRCRRAREPSCATWAAITASSASLAPITTRRSGRAF